jgi:hypothetical protein
MATVFPNFHTKHMNSAHKCEEESIITNKMKNMHSEEVVNALPYSETNFNPLGVAFINLIPLNFH